MRKKFRWDKKYLYWGITAFLVIVCSIIFFHLISRWSYFAATIKSVVSILSPILYGFCLAYILNKLMDLYERAFVRKLAARLCKRSEANAKRLTRIISVVLTVITAVILVGGIGTMLVRQIPVSIQGLISKIPGYRDTIVEWVNKYMADNPSIEQFLIQTLGNISQNLTSWLETNLLAQVNTLLANLTSGVYNFAKVLINLFIGLVVSVYLLYHKEKFCAQAKKVIYGITGAIRGNKLFGHLRFIDKTFGGFLSSKLLDSLIVGIICYVGLVILKMPYSFLIAVIIGVTNIIPFFGPFIGAVPSALLILLEDPIKCLIFVVFILVLQQIDGNIIFPKIQGNVLGLSGFWIMFAILFFGGLFGFMGLILGVPIFAVIYSAVQSGSRSALEDKGMPTDTASYENLKELDPVTKQPVFNPVEEMSAAQKRRARRRGKSGKAGDGDEKDK